MGQTEQLLIEHHRFVLFREILRDDNSRFKKSHHHGNKKWKRSLSEKSEAGPRALQSMALDLKQLLNFGNKMG